MSQITRCPSCATLFKVVPDQLRISDGWVRCGQCQEVFDATLSLQEPPAPVPPPSPGAADAQTAAPGAVAMPASAAESRNVEMFLPSAEMPVDGLAPTAQQMPTENSTAEEEETTPELPAALPAPGGDAAPAVGQPSFQGPPPAGYELPSALLADADGQAEWVTDAASAEFPLHQASPAELEKNIDTPAAQGVREPPFTPGFKAASPEEDWEDSTLEGVFAPSAAATAANSADGIDPVRSLSADAAEHAQALHSGPEEASASAAQDEAETSPQGSAQGPSAAQEEPSFVRFARRQALWHRPAVRMALGAVAMLLAAALLLQVAVQQRHYLASAKPQWRPALEALCVPLRCEVRPFQRIASVVVDGSAFNRLRGNTYRFALTLKNQSAVPVALPAVELTLTDTSDQPVLRRVLTPPELSAPATLPAGGEWSSSLEMDVALAGDTAARIAGYRVLAFYP